VQVGVTLLIHLKPHVPSSELPATSRQRKRKPAKMYSLPGEGYGHQVYPGSVTEVELVSGSKGSSTCSREISDTYQQHALASGVQQQQHCVQHECSHLLFGGLH
jgi:hypothetical protein